MNKLILLIFLLVSQNVMGVDNWNEFRDARERFLFSYPASWLVDKPNGDQILAVVANGQDTANCTVGINRVPAFAKQTQDALDNLTNETANKEYWIQSLSSKGARNIEIHKHGLTTISNTRAKYAKLSYVIQSDGGSVSLSSIIAQFFKLTDFYSLTCTSATSDVTPQLISQMEGIIGSFGFIGNFR